jgi:hydrogenase/urease accessory protein HupE
MKLSHYGMSRILRLSSVLVAVGLAVEIATLLWFHPLSFVLFAFVGAVLVAAGILVFLVSLVFAVAPPEGASGSR